MRILIGALFVLLASSASAQAALYNWTVGTGATGARAAKAITTRSGETYEVGMFCYDQNSVFMYLKGFPYLSNPNTVANVYIDGQRHFQVDLSNGAGGVPQGYAVAELVREAIVGYEMQVQFNGQSVDFSLIGSARSMRNVLKSCFVE